MTDAETATWLNFARAIVVAKADGEPLIFGDKPQALVTFAQLWLDERDTVEILHETLKSDENVQMWEHAAEERERLRSQLSLATAAVEGKESLDLVREFHAAFGQDDAVAPRIGDESINRLRIDLLHEELTELNVALFAHDPVAVLDALTDLQYVLDGAYLQLGFAHVKDAALREVHRSNMSKLGDDGQPVRRADGKILKGPSYSPPDLDAILDGESKAGQP